MRLMTTRRWSGLGVLGALASAVLLAGSCASTPPIEPITPAPDDPELRDRLDQLAQAYASLDVARVLEFYVEDPFSVSYDLPYKFDAGGERHRDTLTSFFPRLRKADVAFGQPLNAWRTSDRVWTTRPFTASGELATGETFSFEGWHSAIWTLRDGTWRIAYEHFGGPEAAFASPMPPTASAATAAAARPTWPLVDAYFDYDRFAIRDDQKTGLLANADWLKANQNAIVTIEGHCDERGSDAYNLELGQKRADTVKRFLVGQGVPAERMRTVSYGRSRPFAAGKGEPAWGRNRRAHFVLIRR